MKGSNRIVKNEQFTVQSDMCRWRVGFEENITI